MEPWQLTASLPGKWRRHSLALVNAKAVPAGTKPESVVSAEATSIRSNVVVSADKKRLLQALVCRHELPRVDLLCIWIWWPKRLIALTSGLRSSPEIERDCDDASDYLTVSVCSLYVVLRCYQINSSFLQTCSSETSLSRGMSLMSCLHRTS